MVRRKLDTSRAVCDTCGKPYIEGDACYSIADKYDESEEGVDFLVLFRHWECHTPIDVSLNNLREKINKASALLDKFK